MKRQKERIIHLDDMLLYILKQWKIFAIGIIIVGVIFGSIGAAKINKKYQLVSNKKQVTTEKIRISGTDLTNVDMIMYLKQAIANQRDYINNSILMKIAPREKKIASIKYQFQVSKDIEPEIYTGRLEQGEKAYQNVFNGNAIYSYIKEALSLESEEKYIKELISLEMDSVGVIVVNVSAPDEELAQGIRDAIRDYLHENNAKILKNYKDLTVKVDSEYIVSVVDLNLQNSKTAQYNNLLNLQSTLEARNLELSDQAKQYLALAEKEYEKGSYTSGQTLYKKITLASNEISSGRKVYETGVYAVKRVLLFICLFIIWCGFRYMWSTKLIYAYDLWEMYGIKVIETLSGKDSCSVSKAAEKITANITDGDDILVVGSDMEKMDIGILEEIKEALKSNSLSVEILSKMDEIDAFKRIKSGKNIILVESIGKSKYSDIERCIDNIYCLKREIIGAVVIG